MGRACDHKGKEVGFLIVIEKLPDRDPWGAILWRCKCACGKENVLNSSEIVRKAVLSCSIDCPVRLESNQIRNFQKKYVVARNGCWIWTGYRDRDGYGNYLFGGKAHRYSYTTFKGPISDGLYVLHKCDTPSCVNPDHLFLGTAKENYEDCKKKDRHTRGEKQANAKLKDEDVRKIRELYAAGNKSLADIGEIFGISRTTAHRIVKHTLWKHIE